jgi:hypothetical protein
VFTALVWLLSAALGLRHTPSVVAVQAAASEAIAAPADRRGPITATRPGALPSH